MVRLAENEKIIETFSTVADKVVVHKKIYV